MPTPEPRRTAPTGGRAAGGRASRAVGVLAWALAAVVAGTLAWWAVSLVGSTTGRTGEVLSAAEVTAALAAEQAAATATPSTPGASPTDPAPTDPAPTDPAPTDPAPTDPGSGADPTTPAAGDVVRTWDVTGGQVATVCRGEAVTLLYATPEDGWRVVVEDAGPDDVEVEFRRGDAETRVRVECEGGAPQVDIDADRD